MNSDNKEIQKKKKRNPIFVVIVILLLIIDAILGFWLLLYGRRGHGIEFIQSSFVVLPIINLFHLSLLFGYDPLINNKSNFGLLKVSFILLIIVNFMVGYNLYNQARFGIGPGFIAFFPLIFVVGINDLIAVLLYIFTQHPQGIAKVVLYAVLIPISIYLLQFVYIFYMSWCYYNAICH